MKRTPLTTPVNDDNISTLIQIEDDKDKQEVVRIHDHEKSDWVSFFFQNVTDDVKMVGGCIKYKPEFVKGLSLSASCL